MKDIQGDGALSDELFSSEPGNMGAYSRITFRRVTKTSRSTSAGEQITLVHSSRVTASRSWSGPRVERPAINSDGHAVFGLNLIDSIPTSSDLFGWVNYLNALIKDKNIGFEKSEVDANTATATDQRSNDNFSDTTVKKTLQNEADGKGDQNPASHQGATGTKLFGVSHLPSFSHMEASL
jgi:hypothetical protein